MKLTEDQKQFIEKCYSLIEKKQFIEKCYSFNKEAKEKLPEIIESAKNYLHSLIDWSDIDTYEFEESSEVFHENCGDNDDYDPTNLIGINSDNEYLFTDGYNDEYSSADLENIYILEDYLEILGCINYEIEKLEKEKGLQ